ncbi:MAG: flagellar basal body P-ring protein FlgI [Gammaproteobacteria bacterium]|nr:flagellar basal body P-ring protein FlgI [Gammaproteobacteria bacterium]
MRCFKYLFLSLLVVSQAALAERIKDLAQVQGVRSNPLIGYGLVVGLNGTGEQQIYTQQSFATMLSRFGITMPSGIAPKMKNAAAVAVHAELPAFVKPGQAIDITVSSIGDAKSLRGGTLLMTPLRGVDGEVYAIAQGNLVVGGFGAEGSDGSKITVNIPTAGRIPNGATVERAVAAAFQQDDFITLNLNNPDFTTAKRLAERINSTFGPEVAMPADGASVQVRAPRDPGQRVLYLASLENLEFSPGDGPARIVVNSRTGTIVIGQHVMVKEAAVSHGNLVVTISESPQVSQPGPLSGGETAVVPQSDVSIQQDNSRMFMFQPGVSLEEIVRAVNAVGAAPGDLMAILEALKQAGALNAELVVI